MQSSTDNLFARLPQLGELLEREPYREWQRAHSRARVAAVLRGTLDEVREELRDGRHDGESLTMRLEVLPERVEQRLRAGAAHSLRRVINATGVVLQTNLGRAPLSAAAIANIAEIAAGYCNLEFDVAEGERSFRDRHIERLIPEVLALRGGTSAAVLEAKSAAVVNNCAAATFLALNTMAEGGEVIVSRGELVEIGGGFRVPDILRKSGAILHEVGTTNRTRIGDYAAAITPATRLILRVHRSNFRIEGFTEQPSLQELIELGARVDVPVFEDQGTGLLADLDTMGLRGESSWLESATSGLALVACSGDKLFGGPQCGMLVGDRPSIERIRKNPLYRAFRVDKLTYAALEATLRAYLTGVEETLPALAMLHVSYRDIRARCEALAHALTASCLSTEIMETDSVVGGGTTPGATLPSYALALRSNKLSDAALAAHLRALEPPVIARVQEGRVLLDLRTVLPEEDRTLARVLAAAFGIAAE